MRCDGSVWNAILSYDSARNIGIGVTAPVAKLQVNGAAIIGADSGLTCNASRAGGLRYNSASQCMELCNGSIWACTMAACSDATPDAFSFTNLVNQATSTLVSSNILQITGLGCMVNVSISGQGSPQYRTCSDSACSTVINDWTATATTISNNQYLQLRLTTSAAGGDTYSATISVGTAADVWSATPTGSCAASPAPGTVCADGTIYAGISPDGTVKMYTTRCDAGQSWSGTACTGSTTTFHWNDGQSNWVSTGYSSTITGKANSAGIAATDSDNSLAGFQTHDAAVYCENLSEDGYTDWYLPASNELNVLYAGKGAIGNFQNTSYWASTEVNINSASNQNFSNGGQGTQVKINVYNARCVRR